MNVKALFGQQAKRTAAQAEAAGADGDMLLHQRAEQAAANAVESEVVDWNKLMASSDDLGPLRDKSAQALAKAVRQLKRIPS